MEKTIFEDASSIDEVYWNGEKSDLGNRNYAYMKERTSQDTVMMQKQNAVE